MRGTFSIKIRLALKMVKHSLPAVSPWDPRTDAALVPSLKKARPDVTALAFTGIVLNCLSAFPKNTCVEILSPVWWHLGVGSLGDDLVVRMKPSRMGSGPFSKETKELAHCPSSLCGDDEKSAVHHPNEGSPQNPTRLAPVLGLPASRTLRYKL